MIIPPILLDTDILSEILKQRDDIVVQTARSYLSEHRRFTFSVLTRYEILRGLRAKNATRQELAFEALCRLSHVLPLTDPIAVRASAIYADLHQRGELIGDADILIAATVLEHGLAIATGNVEHYARIPALVVSLLGVVDLAALDITTNLPDLSNPVETNSVNPPNSLLYWPARAYTLQGDYPCFASGQLATGLNPHFMLPACKPLPAYW